MTGPRFTLTHSSLAGFLVVLALTWFVYWPATSGDFTLDDQPHFAGLAYVEDPATAIDFILTGSNGPTGRPIAMLSFAAQAGAYENGARAFLQVNILIHLLNGILLAWACYELARSLAIGDDRAMLVAAATASLWLLLPLNATASLLTVQRMTTLSAMFVFAGLGAYLSMRRRVSLAALQPRVLLAAVIAAATLLAALSKETGILLPVLVLTLEATVLPPPAGVERKRWRTWEAVVLGIPALVVVAYLGSNFMYPDWMQARRDFGGAERLLTEARILWVYLGKAVAGVPGRLGILRPEPDIARSLLEPATLAAVLAWLGLAVVAVLRRRRYPLLALAVGWFLVGHSLESTVLPLELYFEHRNYVPLVGPLFALCAFVFARPALLRAGTAVLVAVLLLNAALLYVFASMWGEPSDSSRFWAQRYPDSVRAITNLGTYQLAEEGPQRTIETIREFVGSNPEHGYLRIQELNMLCLYGASGDLSPLVAAVEQIAGSFVFTYAVGNMLSDLFSTTTRTDCDVSPETVARLADAVLENPRYAGDPYYNQFHHKLMAAIRRQAGDIEGAFDELETAMGYWQTPELNSMMVTALVAEGEFEAADTFIDSAMLGAPANPLKSLAWRRDLRRLRDYAHEVERLNALEEEEANTE